MLHSTYSTVFKYASLSVSSKCDLLFYIYILLIHVTLYTLYTLYTFNSIQVFKSLYRPSVISSSTYMLLTQWTLFKPLCIVWVWSPLLHTYSWHIQHYSSLSVSFKWDLLPLFAGPLPTSTSCPATPGEALPDWSSLFQIRRMRVIIMMMMMESEIVIWALQIVVAKCQKLTPDDNKPWIYFGQIMAIIIFHSCFYNLII